MSHFNPTLVLQRAHSRTPIRLLITKEENALQMHKLHNVASRFGDVLIDKRLPDKDCDDTNTCGFAFHVAITDLDFPEAKAPVCPFTNRIFISGKPLPSDADPHYDWRISPATLFEEIEPLLVKVTDRIFIPKLVEQLTLAESYDLDMQGHGVRVAQLALALADAINASNSGAVFGRTDLSALGFAGLFHDVGKAQMYDWLLSKETKLPKECMQQLEQRFSEAIGLLPRSFSGKQVEKKKMRLERELSFIRLINGSITLNDSEYQRLERLRHKTYECDGGHKQLITEHDFIHLSVRRGNLTEEERRAIQTHPVSSERILRAYPWPREVDGIPEITLTHHEAMDGSGYPMRTPLSKKPPLMRVLPIVDKLDALMSNRSYRERPFTAEETLAILRADTERGVLDREMFDVLAASRMHMEWHTLNGHTPQPL